MPTEMQDEAKRYLNLEMEVIEGVAMINCDVARKFLEQLPGRIKYFVKNHQPDDNKELYLNSIGHEINKRAGSYGEYAKGSFFEELSDKLKDINKEIRKW